MSLLSFLLGEKKKTASVANAARDSGTTTKRRNFRLPYPSMSAASLSSRGSVRKCCLNKKVPNAVARKGTVSPW